MIAYPVQGFGRQKIRRYIAIGGDWDEFSAQYNNDTTSATVSANGTTKSYNAYTPYPAQSNNPLVNYLVLIIQVSGYITLASGSSSGSATVSVVMNGTTLYSTTISNTNNQLIINQIIPYSNFPSGYSKNGSNTLQIDVTLGTGTASVTITQVQFMFGIYLNGGTTGLTVQIPISQGITYINDDPSLIQPNGSPSLILPNGNPFGLGVMVGIYDPFGISNGISVVNLQNGAVVLTTNGNGIYAENAFPVSISNGNASATLTISVSAGNSILIGYYNIAIIVAGIRIQKGYAHQLIYFRAISFSLYPPTKFNTLFGVLPESAIWNTSFLVNVTNLINQTGSCCSIIVGNFNWHFWQSYTTPNYFAQLGNARIYKLNNTTPKFILEFHHIAEQYYDYLMSNNGSTPGYVIARVVYIEVEE